MRVIHGVKSKDGLPLTADQIMEACPAVFAEDASESRSERYSFVPTYQLLQALEPQGFLPYMAVQAKAQTREKFEHAKHYVRLRHVNHMSGGKGIPGEEVNEIVLFNSHDGTSSYKMMGGIFRIVCTNGLVVGDNTIDVKVKHQGDIKNKIIEGAFEVVNNFQMIDEGKDRLKSAQLTPDHIDAFTKSAAVLKWGEETGENMHPFSHKYLTYARREEDKKSDAWTVLNRVQENLIKGGLRYMNAETRRRATTRPVTNIAEDIRLNRALWVLAQELAKAAA